MSTKIIDTNKHLISKDDRIKLFASDLIASFNLEGITLSVEEAIDITKQSFNRLEKEKLVSK